MIKKFQMKEVKQHPISWIASSAEVVGDVTIEKDANIWYQSVIRGDYGPIVIGQETNIQDRSVLHTDFGYDLTIGKRVTIGHGCIIHGCTIEDDCLIGMGAIILNGAKVEKNCIIGAGAVVLEGMHIPTGSIAVGNPARVIKQASEEQINHILFNAKHYVELSKVHQEEE